MATTSAPAGGQRRLHSPTAAHAGVVVAVGDIADVALEVVTLPTTAHVAVGAVPTAADPAAVVDTGKLITRLCSESSFLGL